MPNTKTQLIAPYLRYNLILALLLAPAFSTLGSESDRFTPEMLVKMRSVRSVKIAPNGRLIAYTLSVPRPAYTEDDGSAYRELHVVDLEGNSRPFITGKVNVSAIEFTPDGKAISFIGKRDDDEHKAVYLIAIDGGEARKVLEHDADVTGYSFSPDGGQIAFTAAEKIDKEIEKDKKSGFDAEVFEEDWQMVRIWLGSPDFDDPGPDRSDDKKTRMLDLAGSATDIRFSPNGRHLAVALAPSPSIDDFYMKRKIHIVEVATGKSLAQIQTTGKLGAIVWNPAGQYLAFTAGFDKHDPSTSMLATASIEKPEPANLLPDFLGQVNSIAFQDDDTIMFLADQSVWTGMEKISSAADQRKTILPAGTHALSSLSLTRDGQSGAMISSSPDHPSEVFTMKHGDQAPRRLTHSNPWIDKLKLAEQQVIRFAARDGLEIEGVLIRPLDQKPDTRYPLIMMVHGGPESHHRNGWLNYYGYPGQIAAADGFAVFFCNYRGSTGRGLTFSKLSQADPAGKEFEDLIDAVDHLVNIGLVDRKKVGVTGISYGGYASAWAATALSEHYAAAVMGFGISDKLLSFALSDIPEELTLVHNLHYPWDDLPFLRQRSPINHFKNCRTPLLIIHGTSDTRVHPAHSIALHRMIKTYGKSPVRLVLQPDEPHGSRRTGSRLDYCLRLMRWMNHYLKGPGQTPPPYRLDLTGIKPADDDEK